MGRKSRKRKTGSAKSKKIQPVPKEFHTVTPYLAVKGAARALEWYKQALGAKELESERQSSPDGKVVHARIKIGDSIVMMSDVFPGARHKDPLELGASSVTLHIYSRNVDVLWKHAIEAGARIDMPLGDMFWGEHYGQFTDPFGHSWSVSMRIQMSPGEKEQKRQKGMKMFEQDQHA